MLPDMVRGIITTLLLVGLSCGCITSRPNANADLMATLGNVSTNVSQVLTAPDRYRVQILVSEPVTNSTGQVTLRRAGFRLGAEYFYPASSIKLCAAIAALQTSEDLQSRHHTADLLEVPLEIAPLFPGDPAQTNDASNLNGGFITIGQELRKICLVSDNQAFNRFYDLTGHEALNRRMHDLGLRSVVLNHRLSETRNIPDMLASAAVTFRVPGHEPIVVPARHSSLVLTNISRDLLLGSGYLKGETLVPEPMDFTRRNGVSLVDLQDLLVKLTRPDVALGTPKLELAESHRNMLIEAMTMYPGESTNPVYPEESHPGIQSKFLIPGIRRVFPAAQRGKRIEVTGKTGRAYGFSIENSYVRNPANGRAVFVTAVLYTNSDGILNDDKYDYASIADPFLADLGEWVARRYLRD